VEAGSSSAVGKAFITNAEQTIEDDERDMSKVEDPGGDGMPGESAGQGTMLSAYWAPRLERLMKEADALNNQHERLDQQVATTQQDLQNAELRFNEQETELRRQIEKANERLVECERTHPVH